MGVSKKLFLGILIFFAFSFCFQSLTLREFDYPNRLFKSKNIKTVSSSGSGLTRRLKKFLLLPLFHLIRDNSKDFFFGKKVLVFSHADRFADVLQGYFYIQVVFLGAEN